MALNPNVVVVAPGEVITATHLNNVRSNLVRLSDLHDNPVETRTVALTLSSTAITTTPIDIPSAMGLGTRGYPRLVIATASLLLSGTAGNIDLYVNGVNTSAGSNRRVRHPLGQSGFLVNYFYVAANVSTASIVARIGTSTGSNTVTTVGSTDFCYLSAQMIPVGAFSTLP